MKYIDDIQTIHDLKIGESAYPKNGEKWVCYNSKSPNSYQLPVVRITRFNSGDIFAETENDEFRVSGDGATHSYMLISY